MGSNAHDLDQRPIRRRKLFEDVVERLETAINDGRYAPGDQLPAEREMMEAYGVGRTAIREALFALQRMGLIQYHRGALTVLDRHGLEAAACSCYASGLRTYAQILGGTAAVVG